MMALFKAGLTFGAILFIIITKEVRNLKIEGLDLPGNERIPQFDNPLILKRIKWQLKRKAENEGERIYLIEALKRNRGNISKTALDVGMDRRQLQNLIRKHKIVVKEFKDSFSSTQ